MLLPAPDGGFKFELQDALGSSHFSIGGRNFKLGGVAVSCLWYCRCADPSMEPCKSSTKSIATGMCALSMIEKLPKFASSRTGALGSS